MDEKTMLEADRKRLRRWIQNEGAVMCEDPEVLAMARPVFMAVTETFSAYIPDCVQDFYVYRCSEQPEDLQSMDGINWKDCTRDAGNLYSIGVSVEALEKGTAYAIMICLHELCHALCDIAEIGGNDDHDERFHAILDGLISRYNRQNGTAVENDYLGLELHKDIPKNH